MKQFFVDGYNVIHSWQELNTIKDYSYESAREKLIELLLNYTVFSGCRMTLVFDAHMVKGSLEKKERIAKNMLVVFTKADETADSYIERTVNSIGRKHEVYVVTSDSLEQQLVFQRGANRISSLEFHNWIINANKRIVKHCEKQNSGNRNLLVDAIDEESAQKLENIRRGL